MRAASHRTTHASKTAAAPTPPEAEADDDALEPLVMDLDRAGIRASLETVRGWTDAQRREARIYASCVYVAEAQRPSFLPGIRLDLSKVVREPPANETAPSGPSAVLGDRDRAFMTRAPGSRGERPRAIRVALAVFCETNATSYAEYFPDDAEDTEIDRYLAHLLRAPGALDEAALDDASGDGPDAFDRLWLALRRDGLIEDEDFWIRVARELLVSHPIDDANRPLLPRPEAPPPASASGDDLLVWGTVLGEVRGHADDAWGYFEDHFNGPESLRESFRDAMYGIANGLRQVTAAFEERRRALRAGPR